MLERARDVRAVVLVHGAFRGGWSWSRVRPGLVAAGLDVHAPSLVGCGERHGEVESVDGLSVWVDQLVALIEAEDLQDVVLVGHSQGGIVTASVAARVPGRVAAVVHLDAAIAAPGERAVDLGLTGDHPLPARQFWVPSRPLAPGQGDAHTLSPAETDWVNARLTPTPMGPSLDVVGQVPDGVHTVVAFCSGTPEGYPSRVSRERMDAAGEDYVRLDCGHDAPLLAPALVVDLIVGAVHATTQVAGAERH